MQEVYSLLREEKFEECLQAVQIFFFNSKNQTERFQARNVIGQIFMKQERYNEAIDMFQGCIEIDSGQPEPHFQKANALEKSQQWDKALAAYQICIDKKYMLAESYYARGNIYQSMDQLGSAVTELRLAIKTKNTKGDSDDQFELYAQINLANCLLRLQLFSEKGGALEVLLDALFIDKNNAEVNFLFGEVYYQQGQYDDAVIWCNKSLAINPAFIYAILTKGLSLRESHRYDEAIKVYRDFIANDPNNVEVQNELGNVLLQEGKYDEALVSFNAVLQTQSDNLFALNNKAVTLLHMNRNEEALECLDQIIQVQPDNEEVLNNKGNLLNNMRKYEEAIKEFNKAISINHKNADLYNNKGIALMNHNFIQEALQCFTLAITLDEHFILGFVNKAQVERLLDRDPEALISLNQAIKLLDDPLATKSLSESEVKYIKQSFENTRNPDTLATVQEAIKKLELMMEQKSVKNDVQQKSVQVQVDSKIRSVGIINAVEIQPVQDTNSRIQAEWEQYQSEDSNIFQYIEAFYWTMSNFCEAQRASTQNANNVQHIAKDPIKISAIFAGNLSLAEGIIPGVKSAIDSIYAKMKDNRYEDPINSIGEIITNNEGPDTQNSEDFRKVLALAALQIADSKRNKNLAQELEWENPPPSSGNQKAFEFFMGKIDELKARALSEKVEIYTSVGGKAALEDVTLLLLYMTKYHKEIIEGTKNGKKLYIIISEAVHTRNILEVLEDINMDDPGNDTISKIKAEWDKFRTEDPNLYEYNQAFLRTMSNFCEAQRVNTKVANNEERITKEPLAIGAILAENLSLPEGIISGIKSAIDSIYAQMKDKRYEDRINSIGKIITNNEDPDTQNSEDFRKVLALATLEIAHRKPQEILVQELELQNPKFSDGQNQALQFFKGKIVELNQLALNEQVEIYTTVGGKAALMDVVLLLLYMTKYHQKIIEDTKKGQRLQFIISEAVRKRNILEVLVDINMEPEADKPVTCSCVLI